MKFIKKHIKTIITIILTATIFTGFSIYATTVYLAKDVSYIKNDGTEMSVADALNELYSKNSNNSVNIEYIWNSSSQNIDYTYNVNEAGTYLVGIVNSNNDGVKGTIDTNSEIILQKELNKEASYTRYMTLKLLKSEKNENIEIKGYNGGNKANAFIYKINNIDINSIIEYNMVTDNTAQVSYTANTNNEKILVLGCSCGKNETGNITYDGIYLSQERCAEGIYLGYVVLNKDSKVTVSSYGYDWGAGVAFILK